MSDPSKPLQPAANASLDDILASLEKQLGPQDTSTISLPATDTATVVPPPMTQPTDVPGTQPANPTDPLPVETPVISDSTPTSPPAPLPAEAMVMQEITTTPSAVTPASTVSPSDVAPLSTPDTSLSPTTEPAVDPPTVAPESESLTASADTSSPALAESPVLPAQPVTTTDSSISTEPLPAAESVAPTPTTSFDLEEKPITPMQEITMAPPPVSPSSDTQVVSEPPHVTPPPSPPPNPVKAVSTAASNFWKRFFLSAAVIAFAAIGSVSVYSLVQQNQDIRQLAADCSGFLQPGGLTGSIIIPAECTGSYEGKSAKGRAPAGANDDTDCIGFSQNQVTQYYQAGTITPSPGACECHQIDIKGPDGKDYGVAKFGACSSSKSVCGESCQTNDDCKSPSTAGFEVICRNGTCEQKACPAGQTQPGSICSCNAKQQCGEKCGPSVGNRLCETGTECGFISAKNACGTDANPNTAKQYCLPKVPQSGYSTAVCTTIKALSLVKPDGTQTGMTVQDVLTACATPPPTANPTPTPTAPPLVCLNVTKDIASPKLGDQVRFTCGSVTGATNYEFRYKISGTTQEGTLASVPGTPTLSEPLVVSAGGNYKVQCRPCVGAACTEWETW